eukprot:2648713-Amphidinium_carterae.1
MALFRRYQAAASGVFVQGYRHSLQHNAVGCVSLEHQPHVLHIKNTESRIAEMEAEAENYGEARHLTVNDDDDGDGDD